MRDESHRSIATHTQPQQLAPASSSRSRFGRLLDRMRATPAGRLAVRIGVGVLGTLVVIVGIILLPLPGPGWAIIFLGLAIWSVEFRWAKRLLGYARARVHRWRDWYARQGWPTRIVVGAGTALLVLAIVAGALWLSAGLWLLRSVRS